jgi:hypothetical protein
VSNLCCRPMIAMFRVAMKLKLGAPFGCDRRANSLTPDACMQDDDAAQGPTKLSAGDHELQGFNI